jgi:hypothetical protein
VILTFLHILRYNNPSLTPKGPNDLEIGKKNFHLRPWLAEIFGKNRKMCFFGVISKLILGTPFAISLPFFQHVLFMGSLIHIPKFREEPSSGSIL